MDKNTQTILVDGHTVPVLKKEFVNANIIGVTVGTNGYHGGDSGHGCRTYLQLTDEACTDMKIEFKGDTLFGGQIEKGPYNKVQGKNLSCESITIRLGGDTELETFIEALEFAAGTLRAQTNTGFQQKHRLGDAVYFITDKIQPGGGYNRKDYVLKKGIVTGILIRPSDVQLKCNRKYDPESHFFAGGPETVTIGVKPTDELYELHNHPGPVCGAILHNTKEEVKQHFEDMLRRFPGEQLTLTEEDGDVHVKFN